jgi:LuxR family maltose regulon positive regulatory protein
MALGLQALVRQAQGRSADALVMLRRAVSLAAPRCLLRSLYDLGSPLREPLAALRDQGVAPDYLGRLLALEGLVEPPLRPVPLVRASQQLPEQLTRREAEVLALLAERWSNQDIAERLVLSINTVRKHTSTIYDKFGVNSRREAVATARALGILPPE